MRPPKVQPARRRRQQSGKKRVEREKNHGRREPTRSLTHTSTTGYSTHHDSLDLRCRRFCAARRNGAMARRAPDTSSPRRAGGGKTVLVSEGWRRVWLDGKEDWQRQLSLRCEICACCSQTLCLVVGFFWLAVVSCQVSGVPRFQSRSLLWAIHASLPDLPASIDYTLSILSIC